MQFRAAAKTALQAAGINVGQRWNDPDWRRVRILQLQQVEVAIDVGANVGQYGIRLRRAGYAGRIVSLEPYSIAYEALAARAAADGQWEARKIAAGDTTGERDLNVAAANDCSSFLEFDSASETILATARTIGAENVKVARLDDLRLLQGDERALLKLDVQGYEPRVLAGASQTLEKVDVIECELSLEPLYKGQPTILDLLTLLSSLGYRPIRFLDGAIDHRTGGSIDTDAIFVRTRGARGLM